MGVDRPVRLEPSVTSRGLVVISYLRDPFLAPDGSARGHTNWQESRMIAQAWCEQNFTVEVIDHKNRDYVPPQQAVAVIDLGVNLGRWAPSLPVGCLKILHATGAHWRTQNAAEMRRLRNIRQRRGLELLPRRQAIESRGIENADVATVLGNNFTSNSFAFAGKKLCRVPISSAYEFPWPEDRDFETARRRFLWMGSYGMVHKGLDLVLEAFALMPDLQLTVCGRPEKEDDFYTAYRRELNELPNVRVAGWTDPASAEFDAIRRTHAAIVYPSCSEGGGGSVIHAMHAGLVPVVTPQASVDIADFGQTVGGEGVQDVVAAVRAVADQPARTVGDRAREAWDYVRGSHTAGAFEKNYRSFVRDCLGPAGAPLRHGRGECA